MSPGIGGGPDAPNVEATCATPDTTTYQGNGSAHNGTPVPFAVTPDWAGRLTVVQEWVPTATRAALEQFALTQFNRAEIGWLATILTNTDAELIAQRDASYAICEAIDWTAESMRPSHAELVKRRAVVAVPQ